jgi:hypothetical protein
LRFVDGEALVVVVESPLLNAEPKLVPDADEIGAPITTRSNWNWVPSKLGPIDYQLTQYYRGWIYSQAGPNDHDEIKRLSNDYRSMIAGRPYGKQVYDAKVEQEVQRLKNENEYCKRKLQEDIYEHLGHARRVGGTESVPGGNGAGERAAASVA